MQSASEALPSASQASAPEDWPGAGRRRGARLGPRRGAEGAGGAAHPHRLHRRQQHGRHRRRAVCVGHDARTRSGTSCKTIDWDDAFNDAPPRTDRSFRRKRDDDLYLVKPKLGFNDDGEVKSPLAYIQGQKFDLQLSRLTLRAANIHDFNKLPIPFHAVAADIETGKPVVLQSGELARAIRASMAVPGAFDPVEIDGKLLVDGLVANNVPVNVARDMGADIVIVVDVGSGLYQARANQGGARCGGAAHQYPHRAQRRAAAGYAEASDILIKPQLGDLGSGRFRPGGRGDQDRRAGCPRNASRAAAICRSIRRVTQQFMARQRVPAKVPVIDFVRIDNQSRIGDATILSHITLKPGQPLNSAQLDKEINEIYGLDVFETVRYEVVEEGGKTGLVLHVKEKSWGPNYLQFGVELASNFSDESSYNLGVLYTRTAINSLNGEIRLGLQIGQDPAVVAEWYQPLDTASRYFINTRAGWSSTQYNVYDGEALSPSTTFRETVIDLAVGREFGTWGQARLGFVWAKALSIRLSASRVWQAISGLASSMRGSL